MTIEQLHFHQPVLIYVPCYNCRDFVIPIIQGIPAEWHGRIECLMIDNHSPDRTSEVVEQAVAEGKFPFKVHVLRNEKDLGYSGSQKLAYRLALQSGNVRHVVMLHGDGQYPPEMINQFLPYLDREEAVVSGYRDRALFPDKEETPADRYDLVKFSNRVENWLTGFDFKEWHSGFVMYRTNFLRQIPLEGLSHTRHIDGEFLLCAGILKVKAAAVPIFKKYKAMQSFEGFERLTYVGDVLKIFWRFRRGYYHRLLQKV